MYQPLADALRPQNLDDVCGQSHILGENGLLRRIIDSGKIPNMIFYGPSGTGKTTVANIIAQRTHRKLCKLNATTASSGDIKEIYAQLDTFLAPNGVLLYLDEIQYFNKKQQQTLLEYIENGKITLIASTTENPFFYVYNALLSRSTVFEFKQVEPRELLPAVERARTGRRGRKGDCAGGTCAGAAERREGKDRRRCRILRRAGVRRRYPQGDECSGAAVFRERQERRRGCAYPCGREADHPALSDALRPGGR